MNRAPRPGRRTARLPSLFVLFAAVSLAGPCSNASADWTPPPPMPDEFDWVQLVSGEWLKGEIRAMYKDSMEFDSEELDLLNLDF